MTDEKEDKVTKLLNFHNNIFMLMVISNIIYERKDKVGSDKYGLRSFRMGFDIELLLIVMRDGVNIFEKVYLHIHELYDKREVFLAAFLDRVNNKNMKEGLLDILKIYRYTPFPEYGHICSL